MTARREKGTKDEPEIHRDARRCVIELRRVDRILSELTRPSLDQESISPQTRAAMVEVGIVVSGRASRKDLVERLWSRKRSLLRQVGSLGDWGPMQPVA
ncbi:MAG TPA: hypothetical protein VND96_11840 [Candidatus Micrarchaeaceae archaeon]|nr:hypothetical protein [Candidatus Micrarchaeaceae archaeon]